MLASWNSTRMRIIGHKPRPVHLRRNRVNFLMFCILKTKKPLWERTPNTHRLFKVLLWDFEGTCKSPVWILRNCSKNQTVQNGSILRNLMMTVPFFGAKWKNWPLTLKKGGVFCVFCSASGKSDRRLGIHMGNELRNPYTWSLLLYAQKHNTRLGTLQLQAFCYFKHAAEYRFWSTFTRDAVSISGDPSNKHHYNHVNNNTNIMHIMHTSAILM